MHLGEKMLSTIDDCKKLAISNPFYVLFITFLVNFFAKTNSNRGALNDLW